MSIQFRIQEIQAQQNSFIFCPECKANHCDFLGSQVCGIQMLFQGSPLMFISAYIHHTSGKGVNQLSNAIAKASAMSPFVFVGMDSNGHSLLWGLEGTKLDRIGESVEEALCEGGLLVLNS